MEIWIPANANLERLEQNINRWIQRCTEFPYIYKIQDRINSMYPTMGIQKIMYIVEMEGGCIKIPYQHIPKKSCSICLEADRECFETLPCGHAFHVVCINKWFKNINTCPLCRTTIN